MPSTLLDIHSAIGPTLTIFSYLLEVVAKKFNNLHMKARKAETNRQINSQEFKQPSCAAAQTSPHGEGIR